MLGNEAPRADALTLESLEPGGWRRLWIDLLEGRGPGMGSVPVAALRAPEPGPVVGITAVVHGDEINGTAVAHALARELGDDLLRGAVVVVPVVNISGLLRNTRPFFDGKDLNRSMAGPEDGRPSQRFGWRLVERVVSGFDCLIDLHTAARGYTNSIYLRADMTDPRVAQLARSLAAPILVHKPAPAGSLRQAAAQRGIAAVAMEIADPSCLQADRVCVVRDAIVRALVELQLLDPKRARAPARPTIECSRSRWLRSPAPGLAMALPNPGAHLERGDEVTRVVDVWGDVLATLAAPEPGLVLGTLRRPFVVEGTRVVHLATVR